jgi:hypothetical protein
MGRPKFAWLRDRIRGHGVDGTIALVFLLLLLTFACFCIDAVIQEREKNKTKGKKDLP